MKKFLVSNNAFSLTGTILSATAGFINIWALARILNAEELGKWLLYITAFTFSDMLRSGIIHTALIKHSTQKDTGSVTGSSWVIGIILSIVLLLLVWLLELSIPIFSEKAFEPELGLYLQLLIITSFPFTFSLWLQQIKEKYNRILCIRLILAVPFLCFTLSGFFSPFHLQTLLQVHILSYLVTSGVVIACGWSGIQTLFQAKVAVIKKLLSFGKYTMGTLLSTNLLKSADTFMISWYLGPAALAAYNLPYKLIELLEIPLRSVAATYLPQAVRHSGEQNFLFIKQLFYRYTAILTLLFIPVTLGMFLFAETMVVIAGGEMYASSATIFRCFVIYSLFLPLDRFLGITLDILNKPQVNLLKVWLMVILNIVGNLVAIHFFASPILMAVATILTVISGCIIGWFLLNKTIPIKLSELAATSYFIIKQPIQHYSKYKAA
ncbi:oligosaccharide flippase family protein [Rhodocytophaga aerolata]|uniref:Oligosaccharide flippase family protein n=1 Tax=Rhodocytophaga aerolata TaxID=455078 RepID=A0ABT8RAZ8_9BACT|nr:oligosaccharide flippase family protein [Rhodocytophaga aerolata]MDO1448494.1 oligosaccharide flippase family protein [Rhodocytophaga aerolata]